MAATALKFIVPDQEPAVRVLPPHGAHGTFLIAPHWPYREQHLEDVRCEMQRRGECRIRAWFEGEDWRAIEGSHRIYTAAALEMPIEIVPMQPDDEFLHDQPSVGWITVERMIRERIGGSTARYRIVRCAA